MNIAVCTYVLVAGITFLILAGIGERAEAPAADVTEMPDKGFLCITITAIVLMLVGIFTYAAYSQTSSKEVAAMMAVTDETRTGTEVFIDGGHRPTEQEEDGYIGIFTSTGYCPCSICCGEWSNPANPATSSGERAIQGVTVGADWNVFPPGTKIEIEGLGIRTVQDKPADWIIKRYSGRILDVFYDNHQDALNHGKQSVKVRRVE